MSGWRSAVAAHLEPEILIVDEVLAVGDSEFQRKCLGKMHEVSTKEGRTVLFVSHNVAAVESMCDSALLLVGGQSAAHGSTAKVVGEYLRGLNSIASASLRDRTDRSGSGEFRFVSTTLESPTGSPVSAFQCGADAVFHLVAENRTNRELRGLEISLGIDSEGGQRVALADTTLVGARIPGLSPGLVSIRVVISKMRLVPGRYRLTTYAAVNGDVVDWVKNAAAFDVEAGDYYGTGQLTTQGQGLFLLDHHFVVTSGQSEPTGLRAQVIRFDA